MNRLGSLAEPLRVAPASMLGLLLVLGVAPITSAQDKTRAYAGGRQSLELDGVAVPVKSVEGGGASAEVILSPVGPDQTQTKRLGPVKYDDITIQVSPAMPKSLADWVTSAWSRGYTRKSGAIVEADYNNKELARLAFTNAVVAETTIPTLDAAAKNLGYVTITIVPEVVREMKASGATAPVFKDAGKAREFIASNFRLEIAGLPGDKVTKIDAFTVKQKITVNNVGQDRFLKREPGVTVYPDLVVTMSESGDDKWDAWFQSYVIKGSRGADQMKSGKLTLLSPDLKTVLATINLYNVGIYSFQPVALESGTIRRMEAKLFVDRMEIIPGTP